jgi:hypothetical protein
MAVAEADCYETLSQEGSESCSSFEKAAKAVHHSRRQRKLFIIREGSESCSSFEIATAEA